MNKETRLRNFRDLFSNPAWAEIEKEIVIMIGKEQIQLQSAAKEADMNKVNVTAGKVEGLQLMRARLFQFLPDELFGDDDPDKVAEDAFAATN